MTVTINWVVATFDTARELGILTPGWVGTYKDIEDALVAWDDARLEALDAPDPDVAYERHLETGWAGHDAYVAEEEQDRQRTFLTDPIWTERSTASGTPMVFA